MRPIIGQIYKDISGTGEIVQIARIDHDIVFCTILADPDDYGWITNETNCPIIDFFDYYKLFPQYNTPLYKAINKND